MYIQVHRLNRNSSKGDNLNSYYERYKHRHLVGTPKINTFSRVLKKLSFVFRILTCKALTYGCQFVIISVSKNCKKGKLMFIYQTVQ